MKKVLLLGAVLLAAQFVNASYLYWQVDSSDFAGLKNADEVNAARIYQNGAVGSPVVVSPVYYNGESTSGSVAAINTKGAYAIDVGDLSTTGSYSYYIELGNYSAGAWSATYGQSASMTADELYTAGFITSSLEGLSTMVGTWHATGTYSVPEPTSAILMLFGAAMLGLKRKNRSIA